MRIREAADTGRAEETAQIALKLALEELGQAGVEPTSRAGQEFLARVGLFGINFVQPPRPELNDPPELLGEIS